MPRLKTCWIVLVGLFAFGGTAVATDIPAGTDEWFTPSGGANHDFASAGPIPADFFDPGSDPFTGFVSLQGTGGGAVADTQVNRLANAAPLPVGGVPQTIPIEIVSLSLESVNPITVLSGGSPVSQWDIQVGLSGTAIPPASSMTISHQTVDGGTYDSTLNVCPIFTFTRTAPPFDVRIVDQCGILGGPIVIGTLAAPWTHSPVFRPEGPHTGPHPQATAFPPVSGPTLGFGPLAILGSLIIVMVTVYRRRMRTV